ncbi:MAG: glycosyltransferase [Candidatus Micrarchaeales archaeon]|jgi:glycosyltransferase involved in cell wall biosynthesis|nr:glycosyltransferase [Candidatus Micrarchaeales archaeon]
MKVGLIGSPGQFDYNTYSSRERYMPELFKNLKRLNDQTAKIEIKQMPFIGRAFSISLNLLLKNLNNYDIVHNVSQDPILLLRKDQAKLITTVHFSPEQPKFIYEKNFKTSLWLNSVIKINFMLLDYSDHLIANSTQTKRDLHNDLGIANKKISVINLGLDKRYLKQKFSKTTIKKKSFKVGYLGIITPNKNVTFALQAFKMIKDSNSSMDIWGKPIFSNAYYKKIIDEIAVDKRIHLKGYAPGEKIVEIYDTFDIFVFPTPYESFGLPILEAQARGLPVIIYKYGKIPKEVRKYCLEAESPEHMAQIIEDIKENGYNEKLRNKATEYARSFTWEKCAQETLEVYKKVLK